MINLPQGGLRFYRYTNLGKQRRGPTLCKLQMLVPVWPKVKEGLAANSHLIVP
jgi:hypothetical protein